VISVIVETIQRYFRRNAEQKREELTAEINEEKEQVSKPETAREVKREIKNQTVQRWLRESEYSRHGRYKEYLGQNLDLLSQFTMEDIMSRDDLRKWLYEVLEFANQDEAFK
jgi:hypothetical protein